MLPAATTMAAAAAVLIAAASTASSSTMGVEAAISPFGVVGVPSVTRRAAWGAVESIPRGGSTGEKIKYIISAGAHDVTFPAKNKKQEIETTIGVD